MLSFRFISETDDYTPKYVTHYDGYSDSEYEHSVLEYGSNDGGKLYSTRIPTRYLSLSFDVSDDSEREKVIGTFSPRKVFTHIVGRGEIVRQSTVHVAALSITQDTVFARHNVKLSLVAPDPFFYSMDDYGRDVAQVTPQFAFPLALAPSVIAGYSSNSAGIKLTNEGHDTCGLKIRVIANNDCSGITITKDNTGEYIKFTGELQQGQELEISTVPSQKYVRLDGENALNQIDRRSVFFSLDTGENTISYDTDTGRYNISVFLYFKRRFLGV